ncbi:MAG: glycine cleavage T C-terminal barrel domain-containing protein [Cyanobacteria bacterium J06627_28]
MPSDTMPDMTPDIPSDNPLTVSSWPGSTDILPAQPVAFDRSHWGRIRLTGADRARFLHNQTTNQIEQLSAGQGCHTVFVTSTGRTIDLATVYVLPESLLVICSPGMVQSLYDWMDRYIFFSDKVTLTNECDRTFLFTLLGEQADKVAVALGAEALVGQENFTHVPLEKFSSEGSVYISVGSDLAMAGYTLWGPQSAAPAVWKALSAAGVTVGDRTQWEQLRIAQGRPMPNQELTDDDNPLEAGLWHSVSFEKGCYIGQETIARLNTYKGVKKRLWGILPSAPVSMGAVITQDGEKIGRVTSVAQSDSGGYGLAYIRTKAGGLDLQVDIAGVSAQVVALPFVVHEYYTATN